MRKLITALTLLLLTVLLASGAMAEKPLTFVITRDMQFYAGPGPEYLQSAFHNTPPIPGEIAEVKGRVAGTDGQDWLLVCFTGHWFSRQLPVWYYLPASDVPGAEAAPALDLMAEKNALAAESVNVYADPEGLNYDGYLLPDETGVTVLALHGDYVCIEAVNPYGYLRRGYIAASDLADPPGAVALENAPAGTAVCLSAVDIPLMYPPVDSSIETLALADGSVVLRYGCIPENAPWAGTLAVISPDGSLTANRIHRTSDGAEESTVEYLLASPLGFRVCRYAGDDQASIREEHFGLTGELLRTDVRRYSDAEARPIRGTAGFTVSLGHRAFDESPVPDTLPLRITAATGVVMQLNVPANTYIPCVREYAGMLLVPVCADEATRLLVFSPSATLLADVALPAAIYDLQAVPSGEGLTLLTSGGTEQWRLWSLETATGVLTEGGVVTIPANREAALLAADGRKTLLAIGGTKTRIILMDGTSQQLAAETPGSLVYAASDGETAMFLLMENGQLRQEKWALQIP